MQETSVSRRYAAALFNQAKEKNTLDQAIADLNAVSQRLAITPKLGEVLAHPLISEAKKRSAIQTAFASSVSPATLALLNLLVDKGRIANLDAVKAEFDTLSREHKGIVAASATSAIALTSEQIKTLEASLEQRTGKDIELTTSVDPSLIGGILVRIGDTVLDGTVKGKLERLREQLLIRK
jgi:F-type H+-transporting ATPase subunit delta